MFFLKKFETNKSYHGFGLIGHLCRSKVVDAIFDKAVHKMKISEGDAFLFANSRDGRHTGEEIADVDNKLSPEEYARKVSSIIRNNLKNSLPELKKEKPSEIMCPDCRGGGFDTNPVCCGRSLSDGSCCANPESVPTPCKRCTGSGIIVE